MIFRDPLCVSDVAELGSSQASQSWSWSGRYWWDIQRGAAGGMSGLSSSWKKPSWWLGEGWTTVVSILHFLIPFFHWSFIQVFIYTLPRHRCQLQTQRQRAKSHRHWAHARIGSIRSRCRVQDSYRQLCRSTRGTYCVYLRIGTTHQWTHRLTCASPNMMLWSEPLRDHCLDMWSQGSL